MYNFTRIAFVVQRSISLKRSSHIDWLRLKIVASRETKKKTLQTVNENKIQLVSYQLSVSVYKLASRVNVSDGKLDVKGDGVDSVENLPASKDLFSGRFTSITFAPFHVPPHAAKNTFFLRKIQLSKFSHFAGFYFYPLSSVKHMFEWSVIALPWSCSNVLARNNAPQFSVFCFPQKCRMKRDVNKRGSEAHNAHAHFLFDIKTKSNATLKRKSVSCCCFCFSPF